LNAGSDASAHTTKESALYAVDDVDAGAQYIM